MLRGYSHSNYTEQALALLEKDICYLARSNWGYGMSAQDVEQELRFHVWRKIHHYNPHRAELRTWAQQVMRMRLIDMSRKKRELLDSSKREWYHDLGEKELSEEWEIEEIIVINISMHPLDS